MGLRRTSSMLLKRSELTNAICAFCKNTYLSLLFSGEVAIRNQHLICTAPQVEVDVHPDLPTHNHYGGSWSQALLQASAS